MSSLRAKLQSTGRPGRNRTLMRPHALSIQAVLDLQAAAFQDMQELKDQSATALEYLGVTSTLLTSCHSDKELQIVTEFLDTTSRIMNGGCGLDDLILLANLNRKNKTPLSLETLTTEGADLVFTDCMADYTSSQWKTTFFRKLTDYIQLKYRTLTPLYVQGSSLDILDQSKSGYLSKDDFYKITNLINRLPGMMTEVINTRIYTGAQGEDLMSEFSDKFEAMSSKFNTFGLSYDKTSRRFTRLENFVVAQSKTTPKEAGWSDGDIGAAAHVYTSLLMEIVESVVALMQGFGQHMAMSLREDPQDEAFVKLKTQAMDRLFQQGGFYLTMLESTLLRLGATDKQETV